MQGMSPSQHVLCMQWCDTLGMHFSCPRSPDPSMQWAARLLFLSERESDLPHLYSPRYAIVLQLTLRLLPDLTSSWPSLSRTPVLSAVDWIACSFPWKSKQTNEPQNEPKQTVQPNSFPSGLFYMGPEFRQLVFYLNHVYLYKYEKLSSLCPQSNCLGLSPNYLNTFSKKDIKIEN